MPDPRVRMVLMLICGAMVLIFGVSLYGRRPAPPAITITSPTPVAGLSAAQSPPAEALPSANSEPTAGMSSTGQSSITPGAPSAVVSTASTASPIPAPPPSLIYVHVAGAVKRPSLYRLAPGIRLMQAIEAAGGPAADADLDAVNLAEPLADGEKVYIPHKSPPPDQEITPETQSASGTGGAVVVEQPAYSTTPSPPSPPGNTLGYQNVTPPVEQPGSENEPPPVVLGAAAEMLARGHGNKLTTPGQDLIDINTATANDLERLPGIGPAMAGRILAFRAQSGPFHSIDDLRQVSGIGDKKLATISPYITVN